MRWAQSRRDDFGGSPKATGHERVSWLGRATPLDVGFFRAWYRVLTRRILRRLDGSMITIERDMPAASDGG